MIKEQIAADLKKVLKTVGFDHLEVSFEHPAQESHGDYSTNVVLILWGKRKKEEWESEGFKNPLDLAKKIADCYKSERPSYLEKIEVAPPGFINFWLAQDFLVDQVDQILREKDKFGHSTLKKRQKVMVEFAHPNPLKAFHIGHLRNITLGESIVRLLQAWGYDVVRANYQGDVGMHIAKAIYALLHVAPLKDDVLKVKSVPKRVEFLGKAYTVGSLAFEEDEGAQEAIKDINYLVYASAEKFQKNKVVKSGSTDYLKFVHGRPEEVERVFELWKKTRQWSLDYFETIYKRVYSHFDRYYFESECLACVDLIKEAIEKRILEKHDGAVIFNGKKYDLDTRVFINSLGLPTYEAKELALAEKEFSEFGNLTRVIHVVGPEQSSFFKVTFKVEELLKPDRYKGKQYHLSYGWVRLKQGKMSSRTGNVVLGEWVLDETKREIKNQFPEMSEETAEMVAVGAVKYSMLKVSTTSEIAFSLEESISLEGNSGPYLQYAYVRTQSILAKLKTTVEGKTSRRRPKTPDKFLIPSNFIINPEELSLLRTIYKFPEVAKGAAAGYAPNLICSYLFDLAQKFNLFYQKHPVLKAEGELRGFRLSLTVAAGQVIKNGLDLLGISVPEKM
ncbi:MAG: arginine--tRNA ligase [bacterium]|nr:arginine--tRNA ligase [bacterium]